MIGQVANIFVMFEGQSKGHGIVIFALDPSCDLTAARVVVSVVGYFRASSTPVRPPLHGVFYRE